MTVSVLICTIRPEPRLSLTLDCLANQSTTEDFELVYVDALKNQRDQAFLDVLRSYNDFFPIKHVQDKPWTDMGKRPGIANARNTGILYCEGDIICVTGDNTWFSKHWIQRHVNLVQKGKISTSPCYNVNKPLKMLYDEGKLSTHQNPKKAILTFKEETIEVPADCRIPGLPEEYFTGRNPYVEVPGGFLHAVSFAISLDRWLNVNGMDQRYDKKGYGFEDCDFGMRLKRMGFPIVMDTANWVVSINDKYNERLEKIMPNASGKENVALWEASDEAPIWANEEFNLRKLREKLQWYQTKHLI